MFVEVVVATMVAMDIALVRKVEAVLVVVIVTLVEVVIAMI